MAIMNVKVTDVQENDLIYTGSYGTLDEHGNNIKASIYETVVSVKRGVCTVEIFTEEHPDDELEYQITEEVKIIRKTVAVKC